MEDITHVSGKPKQPQGKRLQPGSAVQIVRLENSTSIEASRNLKLNTQVLRELLSKADDYPIAVIVIAGPGRKGKSFMLTYIIRYLQALERSEDGDAGDWMDKVNPDIPMKNKGFTFRNGMDRTTDGIWMWSKPFIIKRSKTEPPVAVLVMDTEGCFDPYTNEQEQSSIIGLSLLLS
ncbi:unnamed protein product [Allacma fusca]|uniref:GB1/RHD3-type G domain-containing protein n=1 Tax=Allacma fusca TaxID=39272 RepID=A0A8J2P7R0_9HEXA|nr:unnamed protein product [Allacma fusca]